ncbi:hypothetical protein BH20ACT5_BH20ACT5_03060 [soil metagenome]
MAVLDLQGLDIDETNLFGRRRRRRRGGASRLRVAFC